MESPEVMFVRRVELEIAHAIKMNDEALGRFEQAKADWIVNARIQQAIPGMGLPLKPKPELKITVQADLSKSPDQAAIQILYGPELVADPNFDLPEIPKPVPGTIQVGELQMQGPPRVWAVGKDDDAPVDTHTTVSGVEVVKVRPWTGGRGFYREVQIVAKS